MPRSAQDWQQQLEAWRTRLEQFQARIVEAPAADQPKLHDLLNQTRQLFLEVSSRVEVLRNALDPLRRKLAAMQVERARAGFLSRLTDLAAALDR